MTFRRLAANFSDSHILEHKLALHAVDPFPRATADPNATVARELQNQLKLAAATADGIARGDPPSTAVKNIERDLVADEATASACHRSAIMFMKLTQAVRTALSCSEAEALRLMGAYAADHWLPGSVTLTAEDLASIQQFRESETSALCEVLCHVAVAGAGEEPASVACGNIMSTMPMGNVVGCLTDSTKKHHATASDAAEAALVVFHGHSDLELARRWTSALGVQAQHLNDANKICCTLLAIDMITCPVQRNASDAVETRKLLSEIEAWLAAGAPTPVGKVLLGCVTMLSACLSELDSDEAAARQRFCDCFRRALHGDMLATMERTFSECTWTRNDTVRRVARDIVARMLHQVTYVVNEQFWLMFSPDAIEALCGVVFAVRDSMQHQILVHGRLSNGLTSLFDVVRRLLPVPEFMSAYLHLIATLPVEACSDCLYSVQCSNAREEDAVPSHIDPNLDFVFAGVLGSASHDVVPRYFTTRHPAQSPPCCADDVLRVIVRSSHTAAAFFDMIAATETGDIEAIMPHISAILCSHVPPRLLQCCFRVLVRCCEHAALMPRVAGLVSHAIERGLGARVCSLKDNDTILNFRMLLLLVARQHPDNVAALVGEMMCGDDDITPTTMSNSVTRARIFATSSAVLLQCAKAGAKPLSSPSVAAVVLNRLAIVATGLVGAAPHQEELVDACEDLIELLTMCFTERESTFELFSAAIESNVPPHCQKPFVSILMDLLVCPILEIHRSVIRCIIAMCTHPAPKRNTPPVFAFWTLRYGSVIEFAMHRAQMKDLSTSLRTLYVDLVEVALTTQPTLAVSLSARASALRSLFNATFTLLKESNWDVIAAAARVFVRLYETNTDEDVATVLPLLKCILGEVVDEALSSTDERTAPQRLAVIRVACDLATVHLFREDVSPCFEQTVRSYASQVTPKLSPSDIVAASQPRQQRSTDVEVANFFKKLFEGVIHDVLRFACLPGGSRGATSTSSESGAHVNQTPLAHQSTSITGHLGEDAITRSQLLTERVLPQIHSVVPHDVLHRVPVRYNPVGQGSYYCDPVDVAVATTTVADNLLRVVERSFKTFSLAVTTLHCALAAMRSFRDMMIMYFDKKRWERQLNRPSEFHPKRAGTIVGCMRTLAQIVLVSRDHGPPAVSRLLGEFEEVLMEVLYVCANGFVAMDDPSEDFSDSIEELVAWVQMLVTAGVEVAPTVSKWCMLILRQFPRWAVKNHSNVLPTVLQLVHCGASGDVRSALLSYVAQYGPGNSQALVVSLINAELRNMSVAVTNGDWSKESWGAACVIIDVVASMAVQPNGLQAIISNRVLEQLSALPFRSLFDDTELRDAIDRKQNMAKCVRRFNGAHDAHAAWLATLRLVDTMLECLIARNNGEGGLGPSNTERCLSDIEGFIVVHSVIFASVCTFPFPRENVASEVTTFSEMGDVEETELVTSVLYHLAMFRTDVGCSVERPLFRWVVEAARHGLLTACDARGERLYQLLKASFLKNSVRSGMRGTARHSLGIESITPAWSSTARSSSPSRGRSKLQVIVDLRVDLEGKVYTVIRNLVEVLALHAAPATSVPLVELCHFDPQTITTIGTKKHGPAPHSWVLDFVSASSRKDHNVVVSLDVCRDVVQKGYTTLQKAMRSYGDGMAVDAMARSHGPREASVPSVAREGSIAPSESAELWSSAALVETVMDTMHSALFLAQVHINIAANTHSLSPRQHDAIEEVCRRLRALLTTMETTRRDSDVGARIVTLARGASEILQQLQEQSVRG